jgi:cellulose synthase/poly-beta-1,6-N-acetylglucosamine synthase-like glycosyltransferase
MPVKNVKSPLLGILLTLPFGVTTAIYMPWFVLRILDAQSSLNVIFAFWTVVTIAICFWGYRNACVALLSGFEIRKKPIQASLQVPRKGNVAVLYLCCDDFDRNALATFLDQSYRNYLIYVLDDSTVESNRKAVDEFCSLHRIKIIRRESRQGYKAGAINNALLHLPPDIEFLAIADSDERVYPDFLEECMKAITVADERVVFVQCRHLVPDQATTFARILSQRTNSHWLFYQVYRNKYGLVQFLGHGALIKRKAIAEVGGVPELISEDIALTFTLREAGYRGLFLTKVVCLEGYPADYLALRKRNRRWSKGTLQIFLGPLPRFLLAPTISIAEKLDAFTSMLTMPMSLLFFAFWLSVAPAGLDAVLSFFRLDLAALMSLAYLAPMICTLAFHVRETRKSAAYFGLAAILLPAVILAYLTATWEYARGKKAFDITPKKATYVSVSEMVKLGWLELVVGFELALYISIFRAFFDIP